MSLAIASVTFGCDPEFFFRSNGEVIGAERVIPEAGILIKRPEREFTTGLLSQPSKFVLDGVQVELNPRPHACRANMGNEIALCFRQLRDHLKAKEGVNVDFHQVIEVPQGELDALCDKAKQLGCEPSKNAHGAGAEIKVNAAEFRQRSAGGHLHLGLDQMLRNEPERLVRLLDVVVGNTCVLLDRDPACAERRKLYGRAGEFRTPSYGIEYRTLSNFWLRSYQLMSCVLGLARLTASILYTTKLKEANPLAYGGSPDHEQELLKRVDLPSIVKAINENDFDLAEKNFQGLKAYMADCRIETYSTAISANTIPNFERFYKRIQKKGLQAWFPSDPMMHWCSMPDGHGTGFESFLTRV